MAARPNPLAALRLCLRLAKNSSRRLVAAVECAKAALDGNSRLTLEERTHYHEAIVAAEGLISRFDGISNTKLPKAPHTPRGKRRTGRPSQDEIAKGEALRRAAVQRSRKRS